MPPAGQHRRDVVALARLAVGHEHLLGAPGAVASRRAGSRNENVVPTPTAALDADLAAVIAHDAVADAEAEARAFADVARREERIEDAPDVVVGDAVPRVADGELDGRRLLDVPRADRGARRGARRASPAPRSARRLSSACWSWPASASDAGQLRLVLGLQLDRR